MSRTKQTRTSILTVSHPRPITHSMVLLSARFLTDESPALRTLAHSTLVEYMVERGVRPTPNAPTMHMTLAVDMALEGVDYLLTEEVA